MSSHNLVDVSLNKRRYAVLLKSGEADELAASQDLSLVREIPEHEIQEAITSLRRSTASIEKQTEALKLQQNAMSILVKTNAQVQEARNHVEENQLQKWDVEKGVISANVGLLL